MNSSGWCFCSRLLEGVAKRYAGLYSRFQDAETETAFLRSRHGKMRTNSRWLALLAVVCLLPDLWRFTERATWGGNNHLGSVQIITIWLATMLFLGIVLLTLLPWASQRISIRCWEALWIVLMLASVLAGLAEGAYDVHYAEYYGPGGQRFYCHLADWTTSEWVFDVFQQCERVMLTDKLKIALVLDTLVTVSHLILPIRWAVMVPVDVLVAVLFCVFWQQDAYSSEVAAGRDADHYKPLYLPMAMIMLVVGSNLGLLQQERHERRRFESLTHERVLRAHAEFSAHEIARSSRPTKFGRSLSTDNEASEVVSTRSVPTTTLSGQFMMQAAQVTGAAQLEILQSLVDIGMKEGWLIREDEVEIDKSRILGEGSFGAVYEGSFCCGPVAIKLPQATQPDESRISLFNELRIMRHIRHPGIALFHGACFSRTSADIKLVMEVVRGVRLNTWLLRQKPPALRAMEERSHIMQRLCHALAYLHSRRPCVVHADLKPSNVMVEMLEHVPCPKLLDFGLSRLLTRTAVLRGGTLEYMAPEVTSSPDAKPSPAVDMFAFGQMLSNTIKTPICGTTDQDQWMVANTVWEKWASVITLCIDDNPLSRPTAVAVHTQVWGGIAPYALRPWVNEAASSSAQWSAGQLLLQDTAVPPSTLLSRSLETIQVFQCSAGTLSEVLLSRVTTSDTRLQETLSAAIDMCLEHARGLAVVLIAEKEAFRSIFCDDDDLTEVDATAYPTMRAADKGYMSQRLRNTHVRHPRFHEAFRDFTMSSDGDRWPADYPDPSARKLSKDGAVVLDVTGYCIKCAAQILGISPPVAMQHNAGRMHNTALACSWAVEGCIALVCDSDGVLDGIVWTPEGAAVYRVAPGTTSVESRGLAL